MKTLNKLMLGLLLLALASCGDDDNGPSYEFKNQNLQGEINGQEWSFVDGTAEVSVFDDTQLSIDLGAVELDDPCNSFGLSGLSVFFSVDNEVGLTELSFSFDEDGQTVTLYDPDGSQNFIASAGAIEILTITETEVTGRLDARYEGEDGNSVNGNFSVTFCAGE